MMRKICIALFLSLFASLIHAAVMPIDLKSYQSNQVITTIDSSEHHCDELDSNPQNTNQLCHSDSYQCCLGFVMAPTLRVALSVAPTDNLIPQQSSMALQPVINFIYKPPKV
jgi:hypothetical protein